MASSKEYLDFGLDEKEPSALTSKKLQLYFFVLF